VYARGGGGGGSQQRAVADGADVVFRDTSVTVALFETRVFSFDTVLHNARYTFYYTGWAKLSDITLHFCL